MNNKEQLSLFNNRFHSNRKLNLICIEIEEAEFDGQKFHTRSDTVSLHFSLSGAIKYCRIECAVTAENPAAKITLQIKRKDEKYYDAAESLYLGTANGVKIKQLKSFPYSIETIRLDIKDSQGNFSIDDFSIIPYSKLHYKYLHKLETARKIIHHITRDHTLIKKFIRVIRTRGVQAGLREIYIKLNSTSPDRSIQYVYISPLLTEKIKNEIVSFPEKPLISIVMPVYNAPVDLLKKAIESIQKQWYENWELCIADDGSTRKETVQYLKHLNDEKIKITFLEKNLNISGASNKAFSLASGDYTALMDNDDELTADALYRIVKAINKTDADLIYSDEDKINMDGTFTEPHFKPDYLPDLFLSQNYINHLCVIRSSLIKRAGGWSEGFEGAQDYDLFLKILELTDKVCHIPEILYHWRRVPGSTAAVFSDKQYAQQAGLSALEKAMKRRKIDAEVSNGQTDGTYKISYKIASSFRVSIIIPFKDRAELLEKCISSILEKTTYSNYEIICMNNNSTDEETLELIKELKQRDNRIRIFDYNAPFNYSAINNFAVKKYADGEFILFLNNDIEIITPEWIEELLMHAMRQNTGCTGAKLYFPNGYIQHAGIVLAPYTDHALILMYSMMEQNGFGYAARAKCINNYSAVTAACMMIKKELFLEVGGFDEKNLPISYNDVDLCLRLREKGYFNIFTPYCEAYHNESASRGYEKRDDEIERREKEKHILKQKHSELFEHYDPHYNPNLNPYSVLSEIHPKCTTLYKQYLPKPFSHKILLHREIKQKTSKKNLTIFSHYSSISKIDKYVLYYIEALAEISDVVFVSTASGLDEKTTACLNSYCTDIIVKENTGYDFGAWKTGLTIIGDRLNAYENLILCNDSIFGPLFSLENMFEKMRKSGADIWSVSDNYQIKHHLQSFFVVYTSKAFQSEVFLDFYNNFTIIEDKQTLIVEKEIKFSDALKNSGLKLSSYCKAEDFDSYRNIMHHYWKELIITYNCPFVKRELLQMNPLGVNISDWKKFIKENTNYPIEMITSYLKNS